MKKRMVFVLLILSPACATTGLSAAQRQKASDCMAMCERDRPAPVPEGMGHPADTRDTRSDCEKRCGM